MPPKVNCRLTGLTDLTTDLEFVLAAERHPDNAPYVGQWTRSRHEAAVAAGNEAHFIVEQATRPVGYLILMGLQDEHSALMLRRVVITEKGQGYGQQTLDWIKAFAFDTLAYHRLWFDVMVSNHRARAVYKSAGFVEEGLLRDSWKTAAGYESMVIMSMLEAEYRACQ